MKFDIALFGNCQLERGKYDETKQKQTMPRISESIQANQIRSYRKKRGLRLRDVASLIGQSSPAHIAHWEKGRKLPSLTNALLLSAAIKCPVELLFIELFHQLTRDTYDRKEKYNIELTYR